MNQIFSLEMNLEKSSTITKIYIVYHQDFLFELVPLNPSEVIQDSEK